MKKRKMYLSHFGWGIYVIATREEATVEAWKPLGVEPAWTEDDDPDVSQGGFRNATEAIAWAVDYIDNKRGARSEQ